MPSSNARPHTLKVWCVRLCMFYSTMCLSGWPLSSEAARLRCGTDLLSDLIFVCGDRGIYLGKGTWSGYGARPRGKGIVDKCCGSSGCELQHLELYCAKPKSPPHTTAYPSTTTTTTTTTMMTTTTTTMMTTTAAPQTSTEPDTAQQLFQTVYQRRLVQHLGAPNSSKREAYRKKSKTSLRGKSKVSSSRKRTSSASAAPSASRSPLQRPTRSPLQRPTRSPLQRPTRSPLQRPTRSPLQRPTRSAS